MANSSKKPFLGLKWKALYLTSGLFVAVAALFLLLGNAFLSGQFRLQRDDMNRYYLNELNVLLDRQVQRLAQIQGTVVFLEGVPSAMLGGDEDAVRDTFGEYWWTFRLDNNIQAAAMLAPEGRWLAQWGESLALRSLAESVSADAPRRWDISCDRQCWLSVASRTRVGEKSYVTVFSITLDEVLKTFTEVTGTGISVLAGDNALVPADQALPGWPYSVVQAQPFEQEWQRLQRVSQAVPLDALRQARQYWRDDRKDMELLLLDVPHSRAGEDNRFLVATDVTATRQAMRDVFREILIVTVVGLVVTELILLAVLWKPTTQLRRITDALPLFATNEFDALRQQFLRSEYTAVVEDESDILRSSAINLSYQLEALHSLLSNRAEQLEARGVELEAEKNFVLGLLNTAHAVILTQDADNQIVMVNQFGADLMGLALDEVEGRPFRELLSRSDESENVLASLRHLASGHTNTYHHESVLPSQDGSERYVSWYHAYLPDNRGGETGHRILSIGMDISEKIQAQENLQWLSGHDSLTGLMNRARFEEELEQVLAASMRYRHTGALMIVNLDQFKDINDSSGHQAGDEMLCKVAEVLTAATREGDVLARVGGDEFGVILQESDELTAGEMADRLGRALMQVAVEGKNRIHRISASIGVALFPQHGRTLTEVMTSANLAMNQSKELGRNTWSIFNEDELGKQRIHERVYWNDKVKQVLADDSFDMHFQPIYHIREGRVSHYEALLRVFDDDGEVMVPDRFIAAAERSGLMQSLDERIIDRVMAYQGRLAQRGEEVCLSINLSGLSFKNENLLPYIEASAQRHGVQPKNIIFEITETSAVADIAVASSMVENIRAQGFKFALDDFGVGFSSLHYLKRLPVDYVKIDGSFIRNLHRERDDQVLVKALVDISRVFGQYTVAEFVDSEEVLQTLRDLGVDYAQGFFISRPRPFGELWETT